MEAVELLIHGARQLLVVPPPRGGGAKRGAEQEEIGSLNDGALAVAGGRIVAVGPDAEVRARCRLRPGGTAIDASGCVVLPGFVDPHTHVLFAGSREDEFEQRLRGRSYMEIAAAGGGIRASVRMFRAASDEAVLAESLARLDRMALYGTTTVEVKTGYALDPDQELRALRLIATLGERHALRLIATYLGAHDVPPEYRADPEAYVDLLTSRMIPEAGRMGVARFCDVFCEPGVFSVDQSRRILEAGRRAGLRPKLHADEIAAAGGAELAGEIGAVSADHLGQVSEEGIRALARAGTVAVLLPATLFSLRARKYAPAQALSSAGVAVALATDCNPGSSMTESLPWVIALAVLEMGMTPAAAVTAATYNAAAALGLEAECGSLAAGYRADIQVLAAPSYLRLPYHVGASDVRDLVVGGRVCVRDGVATGLRREPGAPAGAATSPPA